jgi:hypothetical protein
LLLRISIGCTGHCGVNAGLGSELLNALFHALKPDDPSSLHNSDNPDMSLSLEPAVVPGRCCGCSE